MVNEAPKQIWIIKDDIPLYRCDGNYFLTPDGDRELIKYVRAPVDDKRIAEIRERRTEYGGLGGLNKGAAMLKDLDYLLSLLAGDEK